MPGHSRVLAPLPAAGTLRDCAAPCSCAVQHHSRWYAQRNIAAHADGAEDLLFAHADMWLNLASWARIIAALRGESSLTPLDGLIGSNYRPVKSKCFKPEVLDDADDWFWWLGSRHKCRAAIDQLRLSACCYGWSDVVFLPKHAQRAFRFLVDAGFQQVQVEVAVPSILTAIDQDQGRRGGSHSTDRDAPPTLSSYRDDPVWASFGRPVPIQ